IPEEFPKTPVSIDVLVDLVVGAILKRLSQGRRHGVAVLAEGLASILDVDSAPELRQVEHDPHGNIRFAEVDFGGILKRRVRARLEEFGVSLTVVDKNVGYELRCRPPVAFDREYVRELGFGAIDFLLAGGSGAMITRQGDDLVPVPFDAFIDPATQKTQIRLVDTSSTTYRVAQKYMIRFQPSDLSDAALLSAMAEPTSLTAEELAQRLSATVGTYFTAANDER
ncbi:MAG: hypothetical protein KDD44_10280, partial [Bdellovibrionales bacterium]|nr:hypothetical protein [Bdellovibrionales bacterium]